MGRARAQPISCLPSHFFRSQSPGTLASPLHPLLGRKERPLGSLSKLHTSQPPPLVPPRVLETQSTGCQAPPHILQPHPLTWPCVQNTGPQPAHAEKPLTSPRPTSRDVAGVPQGLTISFLLFLIVLLWCPHYLLVKTLIHSYFIGVV